VGLPGTVLNQGLFRPAVIDTFSQTAEDMYDTDHMLVTVGSKEESIVANSAAEDAFPFRTV